MFLISKMYRPSLGHTQPPGWWTPEALFQGVKRPGYEARVADAARFHGGWLITDPLLISAHIWILQLSAIFSPNIFNYVLTRIVKTALGEGYSCLHVRHTACCSGSLVRLLSLAVPSGSNATNALPVPHHRDTVRVCSSASLHECEMGEECPSLY